MKKIALILALALSLSMAACKNEEVVEENQDEQSSADETSNIPEPPKPVEPAVGAHTGGSQYKNEYLKITGTFQTTSGNWNVTKDAELNTFAKTVAEMEKQDKLIDFHAKKQDGSTVVTVTIDNLAVNEEGSPITANTSVADYIDYTEKNLPFELASQGTICENITVGKTTFAEQDQRSVLSYDGKKYGEPFHQKMVFFKIDNYMAIVTVTAKGKVENGEIVSYGADVAEKTFQIFKSTEKNTEEKK